MLDTISDTRGTWSLTSAACSLEEHEQFGLILRPSWLSHHWRCLHHSVPWCFSCASCSYAWKAADDGSGTSVPATHLEHLMNFQAPGMEVNQQIEGLIPSVSMPLFQQNKKAYTSYMQQREYRTVWEGVVSKSLMKGETGFGKYLMLLFCLPQILS